MNFVRALWDRVREQVRADLARRERGETAFLVLVPVVGILTGLSALAISYLIAGVQSVLWGYGGDVLEAATRAGPLARIAVPALGGLLLGLLAYAMRRSPPRTPGTAGIIQALALKGGEISLVQTLPRVAAGVLTVSSGGSLGREGPISNFAAAIGSRLGRTFGLTPQALRVLVCCAVASSIAAVYNAPIGGAMFAMEILIGNFALEIFGPVVISSVLSTLIFRGATGDLPRFVLPEYHLVSAWEMPAYAVLGILAGLLSLCFIKALFLTEDLFKRLPIPAVLKPMLGLFLVGLLGCWLPQVFGNGYEPTNQILHDEMTLKMVLLLMVAKTVATAITMGAGGSGGLFTPSMMLGAALGSAFGSTLHGWLPESIAAPGVYALVGMGGVIAGTTYAPITAVLMIFEQTNSYPVILPLMVVCIISTVTARIFRKDSMHDEQLRRRGVVLPAGPEAGVMRNIRVADVLHDEVESLPLTAPFHEIVEWFLARRHQYLYVTDSAHRFVGAIPLHAIKSVLHYATTLPVVIAHDLVDPTFGFVTPKQSLAEIMDMFWRQACERLPVVDDAESRRLVGWISKRDLFGVYSQEILGKRHLMTRFTVSTKDGARHDYVELPEGFEVQVIPVSAGMAERTLREVGLLTAYAILVLQIRHRDPDSGEDLLQMPAASSFLHEGDRLVVIGKADNLERFREEMANAGTVPASTESSPRPSLTV